MDIANKWVEKANEWIQIPKKKRPVIDTAKAVTGESAHE